MYLLQEDAIYSFQAVARAKKVQSTNNIRIKQPGVITIGKGQAIQWRIVIQNKKDSTIGVVFMML